MSFGEEQRKAKDYAQDTESAEFAEKSDPRTGLKTGQYKSKRAQDPGKKSNLGHAAKRMKRLKS